MVVAFLLAMNALFAGPPDDARAAAIEDLGADSLTKVRAAYEQGLDPGENAEDRKALFEALESPDRQRRQMAMIMLCEAEVAPTPKLLDVCYDGLKDDDLPYDKSRPRAQRLRLPLGNANAAATYFVKHPKDALKHLEKGLKTGDWQQQLLCAFAAGRTRQTQLLPIAAPILLKHLHDNEIGGDAGTALAGLAGFGQDIRPHLTSVTAPDAQQALLIRLLSAWLDAGCEGPKLREALDRWPTEEREAAQDFTPSLTLDEPRLYWEPPTDEGFAPVDEPTPAPEKEKDRGR